MTAKAKSTKASRAVATEIDGETPYDPPATGDIGLDNIAGAIDKIKAPEVQSNEGVEPGSPGFDWQLEYPGEEVFVFTATDGTTVGMAALTGDRKPSLGVLRKLRKSSYLDQMWTTLEWVSSAAALAISDEFPEKDYAAMFEAWSEFSRTSAGESSR